MIICNDALDYMNEIRLFPEKFSDEMILLEKNIIRPLLKRDDLVFNEEMYENCIRFISKNYYEPVLFEKFYYAMVFIYFKETGLPYFRRLFMMMGRGNGKDGLAMPLMNFLQTPFHGIKNYHIDIVANGEDQTKDSFSVVYDMMLQDAKNEKRFKRAFNITKEIIQNKKTGSKLRYNTANAKTKDGKKSGAILFNELHQYENYDQIAVFETQLGKIEHPRIFEITTNGFVRDGPLDDMLKKAEQILETGENTLRILPMIYKLKTKEEIHDFSTWIKANPMIEFRPSLKQEITDEYYDALDIPSKMNNLLTKRFNLPEIKEDNPVVRWEYVKATNKQKRNIDRLIQSKKWVVGIDYAKLTDGASVTFITKDKDDIVMLQRNWINRKSRDFKRIKAPLNDWSKNEWFTLIDDVEVSPYVITSAIIEMMKKGMNIIAYACDSFRFTLLRKALSEELQIDVNDKEVLKMVRPNDILRVVPVIESRFVNENIWCDDLPIFRWAVSNTKCVPHSKSNYIYEKIEPKSRKNDSFMSFVNAMTLEEKLDEDNIELNIEDIMLTSFTYS